MNADYTCVDSEWAKCNNKYQNEISFTSGRLAETSNMFSYWQHESRYVFKTNYNTSTTILDIKIIL